MKFLKVKDADPENGEPAGYVVVGHEHLKVTQVPSLDRYCRMDWICQERRGGYLYQFCARQRTRKELAERIEFALNWNQGE